MAVLTHEKRLQAVEDARQAACAAAKEAHRKEHLEVAKRYTVLIVQEQKDKKTAAEETAERNLAARLAVAEEAAAAAVAQAGVVLADADEVEAEAERKVLSLFAAQMEPSQGDHDTQVAKAAVVRESTIVAAEAVAEERRAARAATLSSEVMPLYDHCLV